MSSAQKDEGWRARRRRRRGGGSAPRNDITHSQTNRPPRRQQQSQNQQQHHQQLSSPQQSQNSVQSPNVSPGSFHQHLRNPREASRYRQSGQRFEVERNNSSDPQPNQQTPIDTKTAFEEEKRKEEAKAQEEKEAQAAREATEREAALAEHLAKREQLRNLNLSYIISKSSEAPATERLSDAALRQLDSSLKKCTGFLRKIRSSGITEESVPALCHEAQSLNLSRYISEVVAAITETKLRSADVEHVGVLCGELHRRYEDFITQLVAALSTVILSSTSNGTAKELGSRKASMRLLVEVFVLGMMADVSPVTAVLKHLVRSPKDSREDALNNLGIIASFVRTGGRTMLLKVPSTGSPSANGRDAAVSDWQDEVLPQSTKATISAALQAYYDTEVKRLLKETRDEVQRAEVTLSRSKNARGDPDVEASMAYEASKLLCEKVCSSAKVLADSLGKESPDSIVHMSQAKGIAAEKTVGKDALQTVVANPLHSLGRNRSPRESDFLLQGESPFDGDEERLFYTEIPSLRDKSSRVADKVGSSTSGSPGRGDSAGKDADLKQSKTSSNSSRKSDLNYPGVSKQTTDIRKRGSDKPISLDKLLGQLSSIESRESVDAFVTSFIDAAESSKNAPKRLAKSLSSVSAQKLNLLPAYSRIAACLHADYAEIAATVAANLEEEFRHLALGRSDMDEKNLAVCTKNAKYLGEYVKFGLIGSGTMFDLLGICMKDFTAHRVDIACHLLETCGRFVYRTPSTHIRMGNILETIWRLKSVKNMEARQNTLVETAFFASKPSSVNKNQKRKCRPPIHEYIRHLIYYRLDSTNIKWTQTQFMKLPWDEELEQYVIKKFVKISRARFSTIPYVSTLIALLQRFKPGLIIGVVDALLEAIRSGMEKNDGRDSQRRIAEIQLLGELHKCGVVDERVVYNVLYQSITLGHDSSEINNARSRNTTGTPGFRVGADLQLRSEAAVRVPTSTLSTAPDPPGDFFRIRIACVLMESCGRVLVASNRRKLEVFWVFFERYIFCKATQAGLGDRLPLHIGHVVGDAFEHVLQRDRRFGKDSRLRRENDALHRTNSAQEHERQAGTGRGFSRSTSLAQALEAVQQVENSAADRALICVPVRQVYQNRQPLNGTRVAGDLALNGAVARGQETTAGRGNDENESDTSSDGNGTEEDDDREGTESLTEDLNSDIEENDALVEREASLSGDDLIEDLSRDDDESEDEDIDIDDDDDDDDDDSSVEVQVERPKTEEEDAFAKEVAAFTAAAVQSARASSSRVTKFDRMAIPMSLMTKKMEEERAAAAAAAAARIDHDSDSSTNDDLTANSKRKKRGTQVQAVEFKMLVRKGGKSQLQDLKVPASSSLAVAAKESETADAARHEETKRLVLGSSIVLNDDDDDLDEEVPLRTQQSVRAKEESIRQQRSADEMELLSTLYRSRPKSRR